MSSFFFFFLFVDISHRLPILRGLADGTQFNVFAVDYRGYGKSEGDPSEEGLKKDAEAMLRSLHEREDVDANRIIVYGQGIGGSLAMWLATQKSTKKLFQAMVIENTFTSVQDMAKSLIPGWLAPFAKLTKIKFDSLDLLKNATIEVPTLFIATAEDDVVPHEQMRRLFRAVKRKAVPAVKDLVKMIRYEGSGHHNVAAINEDAYYKNLLEWSCKVFLKDSCSEDEMKELEKGFKEMSQGACDQDYAEEDTESIVSSDEGDDDDDDDDEVNAAEEAEPESELHHRATTSGKDDEEDEEDKEK